MIRKIWNNLSATLSIYFSKKLFTFIAELRRVAGAELLADSARKIVNLPVQKDHPHNGSILRHQESWVVAVRSVNYVTTKILRRLDAQGGPEYVNSSNYLVTLDDGLNVISSTYLDDTFYRDPLGPAKNGLEDPRIFHWKNELYGLWSAGQVRTNDWDNISNTMALGTIRDGQIQNLKYLISPHGQAREKNWMPWVVGDDLRFVYNISTMETYSLQDGKLQLLHKSQTGHPALRGYSGGSTLIPWGEDYLCCIHYAARATRAATMKLMPFYYIHRLAIVSPNFEVKALSREFFFEHRGAQFCAGIAVQDNALLFSYSVKDGYSRVMEVSLDTVQELFSC